MQYQQLPSLYILDWIRDSISTKRNKTSKPNYILLHTAQRLSSTVSSCIVIQEYKSHKSHTCVRQESHRIHTRVIQELIHTGVTQDSYKSHTGVIQESDRIHTRVIQESDRIHTRVIQKSYKSHTKVIQESHRRHTGVQESYKSPTSLTRVLHFTKVIQKS